MCQAGSVMGKGNLLLMFSGKIVQPACQVASTAPLNVDLGNHFSNIFVSVGTTTPAVEIPITVNCSRDVTITATIQATSDPDYPGTIKLTSDSVAKGIGIRLTDVKNTPLKINTPISIFFPAGGSIDLGWQAQYIQVADKIVGGSANSIITLDLRYK